MYVEKLLKITYNLGRTKYNGKLPGLQIFHESMGLECAVGLPGVGVLHRLGDDSVADRDGTELVDQRILGSESCRLIAK